MTLPRSQELIEYEHRKAAALPVEADEDLVTFRNLPKICNIAASRFKDREEARQNIAVILLRRQMGQPMGGAIKYARLEHWRNISRYQKKKQIGLFFECEDLDNQAISRDYDEQSKDLLDFRQWYMKARCYLPERERQLIDLVIEGKKMKDIADEMGIPYNTVGSTKNHAIKRLKDLSNKKHLLREAKIPRAPAVAKAKR